MKSNILFTVTDLNIIDKLKDLGIKNFVYPLSFFCVGIPNTFEINQIKEDNSYLYINENLATKKIDNLEKILNNLPNNIKGVIFEDLGIIRLLKDKNLEKILFNPHFNSNYETINYMFKYVDEIILPLDLTYEEIKEIVAKTNKKVSIMTFGLISSMYSRRTLLKSHSKHYNIPYKDTLKLKVNNENFLAFENENGTVLYHYPYYNGSILKNLDIKYELYLPLFLNNNQVLNTIDNIQSIEIDDGFLNKKTIYKIRKEQK